MSKQPRVRVEATGTDIFVFVDGVKVPSAGIPARRKLERGSRWSRVMRFSAMPITAT